MGLATETMWPGIDTKGIEAGFRGLERRRPGVRELYLIGGGSTRPSLVLLIDQTLMAIVLWVTASQAS